MEITFQVETRQHQHRNKRTSLWVGQLRKTAPGSSSPVATSIATKESARQARRLAPCSKLSRVFSRSLTSREGLSFWLILLSSFPHVTASWGLRSTTAANRTRITSGTQATLQKINMAEGLTVYA